MTLEVSKLLSGWLNTLAFCRVERRARDEVRAGREAAGCVGRWHSASGMREEGPTQGLGGTEGTRGAHVEHGAHVRDLGGVEHAEWLVE